MIETFHTLFGDSTTAERRPYQPAARDLQPVSSRGLQAEH
jgi:hypothetical protein